MGLSADELRVLNEMAMRTAEEDPAYTRRMMSYDRPKGVRRPRAENRDRKKERRTSRRSRPSHPPLALRPALMLGLFLIIALLTMFGVAVRSLGPAPAATIPDVASQIR
ncbi:hypothetical protein Acsp03_41720 [Actinomadura sp. NBRC 104412]|uniref:hypothetical protein n=1 Tax=Actinomadura sp. NBRC 104412 TaxID=3032203 RepID=UPI0024A40C1F|nr:hypothetical protein [Actinomadura sp. NBRC 104412]GLZ06706.1 hypothetical protein Acsp03_41720 [Actinomadura sp. NBRC 104412]